MNEYVNKILLDAGWYKGRNIDISEHEKFLNEKGYELFESARNFLKEFGMLTIKFIKIIIGYGDLKQTLTTKPLYMSKTKTEIYEKHLKISLIPIAEYPNSPMWICISENGFLYGFNGQCYIMLGDDFIEVLENFINHEKMMSYKVKQIPSEEWDVK